MECYVCDVFRDEASASTSHRPAAAPASRRQRQGDTDLPTHFFALLFNTTRNRPGSMSTGIASVRRQACAQGATLSNLTRLT